MAWGWKLIAAHLPLDGQGEGEPDGRGVEHGGYDLVHGVPRVARLNRRQRLVVVAQRVHVEQPRGREQEREHVGQRHGHEHHVGGRAHVPLGQHHHDQRVGHDSDQQQKRHDEPVHGPRVLHRHLVRHIQVTADGHVYTVAVFAVRRDRGGIQVDQPMVVRGHHRGVVFSEVHGSASTDYSKQWAAAAAGSHSVSDSVSTARARSTSRVRSGNGTGRRRS